MRRIFTQRCSWRRAAGAASIPTILSRYALTHLTHRGRSQSSGHEKEGKADVGEGRRREEGEGEVAPL